MRVRHLRFADYRAMPWKNGGGVTHEIALVPEGAGLAQDFLWRLSIAEVAASGPFSSFPGVDRTLTVLKGGLKLDFAEGDDAVLDVRWRPFSFDGGRGCVGQLIAGPVTDFNVMTRRGKATHRVRPLKLQDDELDETLQNEVTALLALDGEIVVEAAGRHVLAPLDTLLIECGGGEPAAWSVAATGSAHALLVEIDLTI